MNAFQFTLLLIAGLPLLLVSLCIALSRHEFPSLRFATATLSSGAGGILVGWASAITLYSFLSKVTPGFPGLFGGLIVTAFGALMSFVMGIAVGFWFPTNPPKIRDDPVDPAGCAAFVLFVGATVVLGIKAFWKMTELL